MNIFAIFLVAAAVIVGIAIFGNRSGKGNPPHNNRRDDGSFGAYPDATGTHHHHNHHHHHPHDNHSHGSHDSGFGGGSDGGASSGGDSGGGGGGD